MKIQPLTSQLTNATVAFLRSSGANQLARDVEKGHLPWHCYVAVADTGVIGWLEGRFDDRYDESFVPPRVELDQAWVFGILVAEATRRRGVGKMLLRAFAVDAVSRGCEWIAMQVERRSDPTGRMAFFHACGLRTLVSDESVLVVGATLSDVLTVTSDT